MLRLRSRIPASGEAGIRVVAELEEASSHALIDKLPYPVLADIDPTAVRRIWT